MDDDVSYGQVESVVCAAWSRHICYCWFAFHSIRIFFCNHNAYHLQFIAVMAENHAWLATSLSLISIRSSLDQLCDHCLIEQVRWPAVSTATHSNNPEMKLMAIKTNSRFTSVICHGNGDINDTRHLLSQNMWKWTISIDL